MKPERSKTPSKSNNFSKKVLKIEKKIFKKFSKKFFLRNLESSLKSIKSVKIRLKNSKFHRKSRFFFKISNRQIFPFFRRPVKPLSAPWSRWLRDNADIFRFSKTQCLRENCGSWKKRDFSAKKAKIEKNWEMVEERGKFWTFLGKIFFSKNLAIFGVFSENMSNTGPF